MQFIIAYGKPTTLAVIEATSIQAAEIIATGRSMREGLLDDDLPDTTWAEPYSVARALECSLITAYEARVQQLRRGTR